MAVSPFNFRPVRLTSVPGVRVSSVFTSGLSREARYPEGAGIKNGKQKNQNRAMKLVYRSKKLRRVYHIAVINISGVIPTPLVTMPQNFDFAIPFPTIQKYIAIRINTTAVPAIPPIILLTGWEDPLYMSGVDSPMVLFIQSHPLRLAFCGNGGFGTKFGLLGDSLAFS